MNHDIPGGAAWSAPVRAGRSITLTALADGANASVLIVGADRLDRLNIPDTLKSQMSARIRTGMVLMSDRGLALATVVASTLDWHDCLTGGRPEQLLLLELAKHGFGAADLHGCINFFSKVAHRGRPARLARVRSRPRPRRRHRDAASRAGPAGRHLHRAASARPTARPRESPYRSQPPTPTDDPSSCARKRSVRSS